eukprot:TRINITY_DN4722_c1_g3_i1.p1 TRINITY_DN4722_c1_g3~~TRINITY_DN4722_c1_g3_i1.p1  ORF type:complete len:346 (+),score=93.23 TRINITY_DN4722_c1_g3_i1:120-1157(+)
MSNEIVNVGLSKEPDYKELSNDELILVCKKFGLGEFVKSNKLSGGLANGNFSLNTDKGKFMMKICYEKTKEELETQIKALELASNNNIKVGSSFPMIKENDDEEDNHILRINTNDILIYEFLEGKAGSIATINPHMMRELGTELAKLNKIPTSELDSLNLPPFPMGIAAILPFFEDIKQTKFESYSFVIYLNDSIEELKEIIESEELPKGMIHGDLFPENAIFESDTDDLVGLVDFEEVCYGNVLLDIAMTVCGCCFSEDQVLNEDLTLNFLQGYTSIRKLSDLEIKYFKEYMRYASLTIAFWRFRQFNVRYPDDDLANCHEIFENRAKSINDQANIIDAILDQL